MFGNLFGKKIEIPTHDKFDPLIEKAIKHVNKDSSYVYHGSQISLKGCEAYDLMKKLRGSEKVELLFHLLALAKVGLKKEKSISNKQRQNNYAKVSKLITQTSITANIFGALLKTKTEFQDADLINIFDQMHNFSDDEDSYSYQLDSWPVGILVSQIEKHIKANGLSDKLRTGMQNILSFEDLKAAESSDYKAYYGADLKKVVNKLKSLIDSDGGQTPPYQLGSGVFGSIVDAERKKMPDDEKQSWNALFHHFSTANAGKPTKKWTIETDRLIKTIGNSDFKKKLLPWLEKASTLVVTETEHTNTYNNQTYTHSTYEFIEHHSHNLLKGMLWAMSRFHDSKSLAAIATLVEKCFQKIPGQGPAAAGVGNAGIYALANSKGLEGVGHLSRLKLRVKQSNTQKLIQKYIEEQAEKQGLKPAQIEEAAAPDFGMEDGERGEEFKDYKLVLRLIGTGKTELQWIKPDGKVQKTVPAFVKESKILSDKLKKMRALAKDAQKASSAQRDRIDRLYTEDMSWSVEDVLKFYINHGLVGFIGQKLIWSLDGNPVLYRDGKWEDVKGKPVKTSANTVVRLWHPIEAETDDVLAWRDRLDELKIQQPMKQAYREVYILTDAEINTRVYSNRMAAHILKQHQFNTLAAIRGWKYSLLGAYDDGRDGETASKLLPAYGLEAQFWINEIIDDNDNFNDTGIWFYVSTDQVRFHKQNDTEENPVEMIDIPKLVLSEILRDVDLFVGVASVANDPTWQDGGPDARPDWRDYWHTHSFGDLTEVAKTRKSVLEKLLPRLKIKDVAHIEGKFLHVKGTKHTYKIHIGSGNILIAPNDQYLCIVPGRGKDKNLNNVFLPFEGDNGLSIVLSKAFLLAADDKITDTTILSQI